MYVRSTLGYHDPLYDTSSVVQLDTSQGYHDPVYDETGMAPVAVLTTDNVAPVVSAPPATTGQMVLGAAFVLVWLLLS